MPSQHLTQPLSGQVFKESQVLRYPEYLDGRACLALFCLNASARQQ